MKDLKNKKVLFVAHVDSHIQAFHIPFLKFFKENGYEVHVASNGEQVFEYCDRKFNIPFQRSPISLKNIEAFFSLKKIINKYHYDIIHCHTPSGGAIARLANRFSRNYSYTQMVYSAHGFHFFKGNNKIKNLLFRNIEKFLARFTDVLITVNDEDFEAAKHFKLKNQGILLKNPGVGIDIDKIKKIEGNKNKLLRDLSIKDANALILLSVGELNNNKNHSLVIKIMPYLPKFCHYVICGQGQLEEQLKKLAQDLKIENRVHFLGFRNDVITIMKSSDIFIFPSKREGLGLVGIEAMASGLPIIASRIRGITDYMVENVTGYLFDIANPEELLLNIKRLIKNGDLRKQIGEKNPELVDRYDIKKVVSQISKIYKMR